MIQKDKDGNVKAMSVEHAKRVVEKLLERDDTEGMDCGMLTKVERQALRMILYGAQMRRSFR